MSLQLILVLFSLGLLFLGAEGLVRGSASIAIRLGLTPLVVGLTIVAYGTSTPEMFVGLQAALTDKGDIVIGNVVGANILNIALMLGVAALICPLKVRLNLARFDLPVLIVVYIAFVFFIRDGRIGRWEGLVFFTGLFIYTVFNIVQARKETSREIQQEFREGIPRVQGKLSTAIFWILAGFVILAVGSSLLVNNAVVLAKSLGVSEAVIALTLVSFGTTSAELATAIVAAYRREPDVVFGNSIGSCLYNILCIVGLASILVPIHAPGISMVDLGVMIALVLAVLPLMISGFVLQRWEGALLLAGYGVYLAYLWPK